MMIRPFTLLFCILIFVSSGLSFTPCPLLGPAFPEFTLDTSSEVLTSALKGLTETFDQLVLEGNGDHGQIFPNTTSFSLSLFSVNEGNASDQPYFFDYHYTAPPLKSHPVGKDSIYLIGGLTKIFTVWTILIEAGDRIWNTPVTEYIPELADVVNRRDGEQDPVSYVDWETITVGQLASHMAGISRGSSMPNLSKQAAFPFADLPALPASDISPCISEFSCNRTEFFEYIVQQPPVALPGTTPIYSNDAFRILGYIVESISGKSFASVLNQRILEPLKLGKTSLLLTEDLPPRVLPADTNSHGWMQGGAEAAAVSMLSTVTDLAVAGKSILAAALLSRAQTNRWLKPVAHTSNPANSVGYPWVIYSGGDYPNTSIIDVYTALSSVGLYSSYIGLVPDFNVGFTILATDSNTSPDLNAHTGVIGDNLLPALTKIAAIQASTNFGGVYSSPTANSSITVSADSSPGLVIDTWISNATDFRATLAALNGIEKVDALSIRLYPTHLISKQASISRQAFRAVFQDKNEFADYGTATCVSWLSVDSLKYGEASLDQFIFEVDTDGKALVIEIPALRIKLEKQV
ncbi:hypothetical protein MGYG_03008 [Nannizzia gypsea CBS 118893]|uniref:Uncharacterized protein n=1 Tax=Arthroderma gypseum (strain ATCC MYA-4604 / CBS 118893) TaxID=535722 RepID=E4UQD1_ARTGP|nr:hypothetical protein MGYG_03008 [Nannizzia gypsea CBS 118893]EFR00001.1 hypothetical protein MGYG_03008 [Nannizzia gypsea CBS 118893]